MTVPLPYKEKPPKKLGQIEIYLMITFIILRIADLGIHHDQVNHVLNDHITISSKYVSALSPIV